MNGIVKLTDGPDGRLREEFHVTESYLGEAALFGRKGLRRITEGLIENLKIVTPYSFVSIRKMDGSEALRVTIPPDKVVPV